jgi:hypothetical protein
LAVATIIPLVNDTLVFLAISWRLSRNSYDSHTLESRIRFFICGDYASVFTRVLLRDGQLEAYYLLALSMSCLKWLTSCYFPQDRRYHEYHNSDHLILSDAWRSSINRTRRGSERRADECHGLSSIQKYNAWNLERDRVELFFRFLLNILFSKKKSWM